MSAAVKLPPQGGSPRDVAVAVNQAIDGKLACVGKATSVSGNLTLVVSDPLVSADSAVFLVPTTQVVRQATLTVADGSITITFQTNPGTQQVTYAVIG